MAEDPQTQSDTDAPDDELIREEEDAAGAEAAEIGGRSGMEGMDEAERAAAEHGGGQAEGFEEAERQLQEQATHAARGVNPLTEAGREEREEPSAASGEADSIKSTETDEADEDS